MATMKEPKNARKVTARATDISAFATRRVDTPPVPRRPPSPGRLSTVVGDTALDTVRNAIERPTRAERAPGSTDVALMSKNALQDVFDEVWISTGKAHARVRVGSYFIGVFRKRAADLELTLSDLREVVKIGMTEWHRIYAEHQRSSNRKMRKNPIPETFSFPGFAILLPRLYATLRGRSESAASGTATTVNDTKVDTEAIDKLKAELDVQKRLVVKFTKDCDAYARQTRQKAAEASELREEVLALRSEVERLTEANSRLTKMIEDGSPSTDLQTISQTVVDDSYVDLDGVYHPTGREEYLSRGLPSEDGSSDVEWQVVKSRMDTEREAKKAAREKFRELNSRLGLKTQ